MEWNFPPAHVNIAWTHHPVAEPEWRPSSQKMLTEFLEFQVFQPDEFIAGHDSVVVLGHERCRVKATGRLVEAKWVQIFTLRDGRISRYREYSDTAAWDTGYSATGP
jgi:ketosteroid isomerase-like protein